MSINKGIFKEIELCKALNNMKVKDLSNNLRTMLTSLYGSLDDNKIVTCFQIEGVYKPDIVIIYDGIKKYISVKTGRAENVHQEYIKSLILFMRENGISTETQKTILYYQYGDGTLDGTGKERFNYNYLRVILDKRIKEANIELNENPKFVLKFFERVVFLGIVEGAMPIDALYFGDCNFGNLASVNQITKHILRKDFSWMDNLHIGPIQLRPHARYIGKQINKEVNRHRVDCYWAHLDADIEYISQRYNF